MRRSMQNGGRADAAFFKYISLLAFELQMTCYRSLQTHHFPNQTFLGGVYSVFGYNMVGQYGKVKKKIIVRSHNLIWSFLLLWCGFKNGHNNPRLQGANE